MNVINTVNLGKESTYMTFTIDIENNISAFATQEEAASSTNPFESFAGQKELDSARHRLAGRALGSYLEQPAGRRAGEGVQDLPNRGASKIWESIQGLGEAVERQS